MSMNRVQLLVRTEFATGSERLYRKSTEPDVSYFLSFANLNVDTFRMPILS